MTTRFYIPGSEWLYMKIYIGSFTADRFIAEHLGVFSNNLLKKQMIDLWFFIRYQDPEYHIRARFHTKQAENLGKLLQLFPAFLRDCGYDERLSPRIEVGTYARELHRYGEDLMDLTEQMFFIDSVHSCKIIKNLLDTHASELRRVLVSMLSVDSYMNAFKMSLDLKESLLSSISKGYSEEFSGRIDMKKMRSIYYNNKAAIEKFMDGTTNGEEKNDQLFQLIDARSEDINPIADAILYKREGRGIIETLPSYLHMMNNRLFNSKSRVYELLSYCYLHIYYKSLLARNIY